MIVNGVDGVKVGVDGVEDGIAHDIDLPLCRR